MAGYATKMAMFIDQEVLDRILLNPPPVFV
jgi:hypothetical protein